MKLDRGTELLQLKGEQGGWVRRVIKITQIKGVVKECGRKEGEG
jgi:hypothetical protein